MKQAPVGLFTVTGPVDVLNTNVFRVCHESVNYVNAAFILNDQVVFTRNVWLTQGCVFTGIVVGVTIGVSCIVVCFVAIVWRKRCVKSASREYGGATVGSGSHHINGNGCYREWDRSPASHTRIMAAPSENQEMDYFVAAVTTNIPCENNTDHLDTKVEHTLFILHY
jgi:hypothetical protein